MEQKITSLRYSTTDDDAAWTYRHTDICHGNAEIKTCTLINVFCDFIALARCLRNQFRCNAVEVIFTQVGDARGQPLCNRLESHSSNRRTGCIRFQTTLVSASAYRTVVINRCVAEFAARPTDA